MGEYQAKADRMDTLLGEAGGSGRVRRRLDLFGELITVVVGKYNELSEGGHMLLEAMASSRAALTMCCLYSIFSSQSNEVGHYLTPHNCDVIQHIFSPTRSIARKTLL